MVAHSAFQRLGICCSQLMALVVDLKGRYAKSAQEAALRGCLGPTKSGYTADSQRYLIFHNLTFAN